MDPIEAIRNKRDELLSHREAVRSELIATEGAIQVLDSLLCGISCQTDGEENDADDNGGA